MPLTHKEPSEIDDLFQLTSGDTMVLYGLGTGMMEQADRDSDREMVRCGLYLGMVGTSHLNLLEINSAEPSTHEILQHIFGYEPAETEWKVTEPDERFKKVRGTVEAGVHIALPPLSDGMRMITLTTVNAGIGNDEQGGYRPWQRELMRIIRPHLVLPKRMIPLVELETPWVRQLGDER